MFNENIEINVSIKRIHTSKWQNMLKIEYLKIKYLLPIVILAWNWWCKEMKIKHPKVNIGCIRLQFCFVDCTRSSVRKWSEVTSVKSTSWACSDVESNVPYFNNNYLSEKYNLSLLDIKYCIVNRIYTLMLLIL